MGGGGRVLHSGESTRGVVLNYFTEMCSGSEEGSYLRLLDFVSFNSRLESNKEEGRKARKEE